MGIVKRLAALTTDDEQRVISNTKTALFSEFKEKHHSAICIYEHPRLLFAFWQSDFNGGRIPYWHVMNEHKSRYSTLSMQGLREWKVI